MTNCSGGALPNDQAVPVIIGCTFKGNSAAVGGAMFDFSSSSTIIGSTFSCNTATIDGGAIFLDPLSVTTILDCTFQQNRTTGSGGGIFFNSTGQVMQDSQLCSNVPDQVTGPFFNVGGNSITPICVACPDLNNDGIVNGGDLAVMLTSWGTCATAVCPGDLNGDSVVDGLDLSILLASWGPCLSCP